MTCKDLNLPLCGSCNRGFGCWIDEWIEEFDTYNFSIQKLITRKQNFGYKYSDYDLALYFMEALKIYSIETYNNLIKLEILY